MPETMTRQETFNKAYLFILKQGKQSTDGMGMCQYRGPDNAMCAAGCLIDDQHYSGSFESHALDDEGNGEQQAIARALVLSGVDKEDVDMVCDLQTVHDGVSNVKTGRPYTPAERDKIENDFVTHWKAGCAVIADKYGLTLPRVPA